MNTSSLNSYNDRSILSLNDIIPSVNIDNLKVLFFPKFISCVFYDEHSIVVIDLISKTIVIKLSFPKEYISHIKIINENTISYIKHYSSYDQIIVTNLKCLDEFCELKIKEKVYDYIFYLNEKNNYLFYILTKEENFLIYNNNVLIKTFQFGTLINNIFNNSTFALIDSIQLFPVEHDINLIFILFKNGMYFILKSNKANITVDNSQNSFGNYNHISLVKVDKFEYNCKEEQSNLIYFLIVMNYIDEHNNYKHLISGFKVNMNGEFFNLGNIEGEHFVVDSYRYGNYNLDKHFLYCMCVNKDENNYYVQRYDIVEFVFDNEEILDKGNKPLYKEATVPKIQEGASIFRINGVSLVPSYESDINKYKENTYSEYISFNIITKLIQNNCSFMQLTINISFQNDDDDDGDGDGDGDDDDDDDDDDGDDVVDDDVVAIDVDKFITYCNNQDIYTIKQTLLQTWREKLIKIQINVNDSWEKMYLIYLIYCGNVFSIKKYLWLKDTNNSNNYLVSIEIIEDTYKHMHSIIKNNIKTQHITKETRHYIILLLEITKILQNRTCTSNKKLLKSEEDLLKEASILTSNLTFELENFLLISNLETLHEKFDFIQLDLDNITFLQMFSLFDNKLKLKSCSTFIDKFIEMTSISDESSLVNIPLYKTLFYTKFVLFLYYYVLVKRLNISIDENNLFSFCNNEYKQFHLICDVICSLDSNENQGRKVIISDTDILAFVKLFVKILEIRKEDVNSEVNVEFMNKLKELPELFIKALGDHGYKNEAFYLGYGIEPYIMEVEVKERIINMINSFNMLPFLSDLN